jgi:hypothetical protein
MEQLFRRMGIPNTSVDWTTPISKEHLPPTETLNSAQRSLSETHLGILSSIATNTTFRYVWILEDDVIETIPAKTLMKRLERTLTWMPPSWDLLYLEYCLEKCWRIRPVYESLYRVHSPLCTASVLYPVESAAKWVALSAPMKESLPIDKIYRHWIVQGKAEAYLVYPPWFVQDFNTFGTTVKHYPDRSSDGYLSCEPLVWFRFKFKDCLWMGLCIIGVYLWRRFR